MPVDFTNEQEVKEYLENLGTEYRFGCFSEKKPEACHLLGDYLSTIKKDFHKSARIYKSNCDDENFPRSCHSYGNLLFHGQGVDKKNYDLACEYYIKACSLGVAPSCFNAGMLVMRPNQKKERDYTKGVELLDKGCTLGNSHACYILSGLYISGLEEENSVAKDMKKAFSYSEKACNLDHLYGCINLSQMYMKGEGCEKNEEKAKEINKKIADLKMQLQSRTTIEFQRGSDPF